MIAPRVALANKRTEMLSQVPELTLARVTPECEPVYYLYNVLVPREWAGAKRDALMALLKKEYGVDTVVANPPVYQTDSFLRRMTLGQACPKAEELGGAPLQPAAAPADVRRGQRVHLRGYCGCRGQTARLTNRQENGTRINSVYPRPTVLLCCYFPLHGVSTKTLVSCGFSSAEIGPEDGPRDVWPHTS